MSKLFKGSRENMARVSEMQGVYAQITVLKSDGERRHPAYCVFAEGKGKKRTCTCAHGLRYNEHCNTAAKCDFYEKKK